MPRRLLLAVLILVAAPLVLLGWMSTSALRDSERLAAQQTRGLLTDRLKEIDRNTAKVFERYERRIAQKLSDSSNMIAQLRRIQLKDPVARQGIFVSDDGLLLYPPQPTTTDSETISLYAALSSMIGGRPDLMEANRSALGDKKNRKPPAAEVLPPQQTPRPPARILPNSRWQVWYMDQGAQLILWFGRDDGTTAGVLLERSRWMSDLTAALPDSSTGTISATSRSGYTALVDESQQLVYRWGDNTDTNGSTLASLPLSPPLATWQLEFHSSQSLVPPTSMLPIALSLSGIAIMLLTLGGYVLTSVQRQMKTARDRVSFAGQVSHELRTPLTNIRLYAELAESDADALTESELAESIKQRLGVIDSESRRLGRLVSGVLEMIRDDGKQRPPHQTRAIPDTLIAQTLEQFAPSMRNAKIVVNTILDAAEPVMMDADIFEMALVNLLSNVEKYAAAGEYLQVESRIDSGKLMVKVSDRGPGIAGRYKRSIFRPFFRLDDSVNAPSGTGIGLTIALRAARRHGGNLTLLPTDQGACFELQIPVETVAEKS